MDRSGVLPAERPQLRAQVVVLEARGHVADPRLPGAARELAPRPHAAEADHPADGHDAEDRHAGAEDTTPTAARRGGPSAVSFLWCCGNTPRGGEEGEGQGARGTGTRCEEGLVWGRGG